MDPEDVINLLDSCWFNYEILKKDQSFKANQSNSSEPRFSSLRSILVRSKSDDIRSFNYGSFSPNSVLFTSNLQSIPSGKSDSVTTKQEQVHEEETIKVKEVTNGNEQTALQEGKKNTNKKRRHGFSKSLSDLEFEELKGFMDLGFVFSEEDKDSSLVEIIPGLQRLGGEREISDDDKGSCSSTAGARRPYLSEAWVNMDRRLQTPLLNWEIPVVRDEIDMKDNLKSAAIGFKKLVSLNRVDWLEVLGVEVSIDKACDSTH
ncbi:hypothetical protein LXL04_034443 [Taraxacum kok-saghyz]